MSQGQSARDSYLRQPLQDKQSTADASDVKRRQCTSENNDSPSQALAGKNDRPASEHGPQPSETVWSRNLRVAKVLTPYFWPSNFDHAKRRLAVILLCVILTRITNAISPVLLGRAVNMLGSSDALMRWDLVIEYFLVTTLDTMGLVGELQDRVWNALEDAVTIQISEDAYSHYMDMSSDFHESSDAQKVFRAISRVNIIPWLARIFLLDLIPDLLDAIIAVAFLYRLFDPYMSMSVAVSICLYALSRELTIRRSVSERKQDLENWERKEKHVSETTRNWPTVNYFVKIGSEKRHYASLLHNYFLLQTSRRDWSTVFHVLERAIWALGLCFVSSLAAWQIKHSTRQVGDFVVIMTYWSQIMGPVASLSSNYKRLSERLVDYEDLVRLLQATPLIQDRQGAVDFHYECGAVEVAGVNFSYDERRPILSDISFAARPGQTIAIVGETGGGKSTILKLLFRLYNTSAGSIKIDGQDIKEVKMESFRRHIAVIPQDCALFNASILDNLKYGKPDASLAECQDACRATAVHEKVTGFAQGYSTVVGDRGMKLSGGELQRLAIARAMLKDPGIVLLDEATSSIDSETETFVQANLRKWTRKRTTLVVAHRLSTIQHADSILVIKDGRIVEEGTHETLLRSNGQYSRMWSLQVGSTQPDHH